MKKYFTKFLAMMLSIATLLSASTTAFATEAISEEMPVVINATTPANNTNATRIAYIKEYWMGKTMDYVRIPCSFTTGGGMFSVIVEDFNPNDYRMDIILGGRDGTLWQEEDCLHNSSSRAFECTYQVTYVNLRIVPRNRLLFPAKPKDFLVKVTW